MGLLVVSRRVGESVSINGGEIAIEIVDIKSDRVRLSFDADRSIAIFRTECVHEVEFVTIRFGFFVGMQNGSWIKTSEVGHGRDTKSAGRDALNRLRSRLENLDIEFIHFGQPELLTEKARTDEFDHAAD